MSGNATNEFLLAHLKDIQAKIAEMSNGMSELKTDVRAVKGHMAAIMISQTARDGAIARMQERLDRIERRLWSSDTQ